MPVIRAALSLCAFLCALLFQAQQVSSLARLLQGYLSNANSFGQKLDHKTDKLLTFLQQQEGNLFSKLTQNNLQKAVQVMDDGAKKYDALRQWISNPYAPKN